MNLHKEHQKMLCSLHHKDLLATPWIPVTERQGVDLEESHLQKAYFANNNTCHGSSDDRNEQYEVHL